LLDGSINISLAFDARPSIAYELMSQPLL